MSSTTQKVLIGAVIIIAIGGYVYWSSSHSASTAAVATSTTSDSVPTDTTGSVATSAASTGSTGTASSGMYQDGTYTGSVANSVYGNVQVSATVSGGKLTDVTFLQYPDGEDHSKQLSEMAMPALKSEAIASQSASVDVVSGATQTSEAFQQSLASALAQAQA